MFCGGENPCLKNPTYILAYIWKDWWPGEREDAGLGGISFGRLNILISLEWEGRREREIYGVTVWGKAVGVG